jgi:hypothetical protein
MSLAVMAFGIAAAMLAVGVTHLLLPRAQLHLCPHSGSSRLTTC